MTETASEVGLESQSKIIAASDAVVISFLLGPLSEPSVLGPV